MRMQTKSRAGFTIVEMMVSMALTLFIMVILSQAFATSLDTFTSLKALGDMQEKLRSATIILRDDLANDHFEGKRRLNDMTLMGQPVIALQPPQAGFFATRQGSKPSNTLWNAATTYAPGDAVMDASGKGYTALATNNGSAPPSANWQYPARYYYEGTDTNGMSSYRATDHVLYMTVKRKGNRPQSFFTAVLNGNANILNPFFTKATAYDIPVAAMPDTTLTIPYTGGNVGFY